MRVIKNLLLVTSPFYKYKIVGQSMSPTFSEGKIVLVNKLAYLFKKPQKGEIVAARDPRDGKVLIKRIHEIEAKQYFLRGDNPTHSTDSRSFGMIGRKEIIGKVIF